MRRSRFEMATHDYLMNRGKRDKQEAELGKMHGEPHCPSMFGLLATIAGAGVVTLIILIATA